MKKVDVAIVGVTGLVGQTFLKVLNEYEFPINNLYLYASKRSEGKMIEYKNKQFRVRELKEDNIEKVDFVFMSVGESLSKKYAPLFEKEGAIVIDNSNAWRMDENCALIVPEININDINNKSNIIANPNCSTIQSVIPLFAIAKKYDLEEIRYVTFQAVSGSGMKGIEDLTRGKEGKSNNFYPCNISQNCLPHIGDFLNNDYTKEEMKMVNETRKILNNQTLKISATCVRVPIERCHGVMIQVKLKDNFDIKEIINLLSKQEGIKIRDKYPLADDAFDNDFVYVGRIRKDLVDDKSLLFYCVADNIRRGAASNAVKIAENILKNN